MFKSARFSSWLARAPAVTFSAYAITAAFGTYFCMYAFRRPFTVGTYAGIVKSGVLSGLDYKTLFLVSQVMGYAVSKIWGIKVVSELRPSRRALGIFACIGIAEAAL